MNLRKHLVSTFFCVVSVFITLGCSGEPDAELLPGQCAVAIPLVGATGSLTVEADGSLTDSAARRVTMRGINAGGRSKWAPFAPFPISDDDTLATFSTKADAYFARLGPWGLDTVRMPFSWEALEPTKGTWDEGYLDRYEALVNAAGALGIRVIVDFHQDVFASPFCGDGFPVWALKASNQGPACRDNKNWFVHYLQTPVEAEFTRFFANEDGLLDAFKEMWTKVAKRFADNGAVVGFEILNEPGGWRADNLKTWKLGTLNPFHSEMIALLRKPEIGGGKLVLYDNPGVEALAANTQHVRPKGDGVIYAPHYYDSDLLLGGKAAGRDPNKDLATHVQFANNEGLHVLLGEFGYGHGATGGDTWLANVMHFVDTQRWSSTLWEYSQSAELWNKEDLSVINADGSERPILDVYVRPWLRAVAGSGEAFAFDPSTGKVSASWASKEGVSEIVVPSRLYPAGPKDIVVSGGCWTWDADRSELRVRGETGAKVSIAFGK